jgi:hypothetical protein
MSPIIIDEFTKTVSFDNTKLTGFVAILLVFTILFLGHVAACMGCIGFCLNKKINRVERELKDRLKNKGHAPPAVETKKLK